MPHYRRAVRSVPRTWPQEAAVSTHACRCPGAQNGEEGHKGLQYFHRELRMCRSVKRRRCVFSDCLMLKVAINFVKAGKLGKRHSGDVINFV